MLKNITRSDTTSGFTVIEMLVTITLFAMTVTMLVTFLVFVQNSQRVVQYTDIAKNIAKSKIESIRTNPSVLVNGTTTFTSELPQTMPSGSTGKVTISDSPVVIGMKDVEVSVSFKYPATVSQPKTITLTALAGQSGFYQ